LLPVPSSNYIFGYVIHEEWIFFLYGTAGHNNNNCVCAREEKVALAGGGKDSEQGTHKCEMNSGEGNGKPLLESNSCLKNPL
jgi:hypothetical protein